MGVLHPPRGELQDLASRGPYSVQMDERKPYGIGFELVRGGGPGGGELRKLKGTIGEVVPNRKIVFNYGFPISLVSPGFEWLIEPKGSYSVFTAVGYVRCMRFYRLIARKHVDTSMEVGKKHIREEGENLKKILESKKN